MSKLPPFDLIEFSAHDITKSFETLDCAHHSLHIVYAEAGSQLKGVGLASFIELLQPKIIPTVKMKTVYIVGKHYL